MDIFLAALIGASISGLIPFAILCGVRALRARTPAWKPEARDAGKPADLARDAPGATRVQVLADIQRRFTESA